MRMDASPNPYSPPSADIVARVDTAMAGEGHMVSTTVVELLRRTKTWVRVVGVVMWLGVGLMVLAALGMGVVSLTMGAAGGADAAAPFGSSGMMLGLTLMYLVLAGVYVMPATKLWNYGSRIDDLLHSRSNADLEAALDAQRGFWTFVGVAFLVMIALYAFVVVGAVAFGALGAASSQ
jgi:hypothetical protein